MDCGGSGDVKWVEKNTPDSNAVVSEVNLPGKKNGWKCPCGRGNAGNGSLPHRFYRI